MIHALRVEESSKRRPREKKSKIAGASWRGAAQAASGPLAELKRA
jgi:hypothetical protein